MRGDICPGCGSNVHEQIISDDPEEVEIDKIPGLEQFLDTSLGILPETEKDEEIQHKPSSTLPFGMGGDSVSMKSTLPFGVGSHSLPFSTTESNINSENFDGVELNIDENESFISQSKNPEVNTLPPALELEEIKPIELESQIPEITNIELPSILENNGGESEKIDSEEVIHHDFTEDSLTTEVEVDLDNLVEYTTSSQVFDPAGMEAQLNQNFIQSKH